MTPPASPTRIVGPEEAPAAVSLLRTGEPVVLPTETVYGLAADALRPEAAARIFEIKERPYFDPLICHLPTLEWLERMSSAEGDTLQTAHALAAQFWPGPLTMVLPRRDLVPDLVTSALPTVALRMSAHPVFRAICSAFAGPLAAPSANRFGRISPTQAAHAHAELAGRVRLIVDGGPAQHGLESTIVAVEGRRLRILRHGPITREDLSAFGEIAATLSAARPEAPGQLASHYAPRTPLMLLARGELLVPESAAKVALLTWQSILPETAERFHALETLSPAGDLREAAATLFAKMRALDAAGADVIFAQPVPEIGLGVAIMDRLRRAAEKAAV